MNEKLEKKLEQEYRRVSHLFHREYGIYPSRFLQMLQEHGAIQTTIRLVMDPIYNEGFTKLWELGRLDLSVEAIILQEPYRNLFSDEVLNKAKEKLQELEYSADYLSR